jgi:hypothetical protein
MGATPNRRNSVKYPEEKEDWQLAVSLAQALILVNSARQHGLVGIDPKCDIRRCEDILKRGKAIGVEPLLADVDTIIRALTEEPK